MKYLIFYVIDLIWIIFFLGKAIIEDSTPPVGGYVPFEGMGEFLLYSGLFLAGILAFVIVAIIQIISIIRNKR